MPILASAKRIGLMLGCFLCVIVAVLMSLPKSHPPDEQAFIQNFQTHQNEFEKIRAMFQEDRQIIRVTKPGIVLSGSLTVQMPTGRDISLSRFQDYSALLARIGASSISRSDHDDAIWLTTWASGWAADTKRMGLCWKPETPEGLVRSLDEVGKPGTKPGLYFQSVSDNWYLFLYD
jgi:hypothetical protein